MRHLSRWAKGHPIKARLIIISSHILFALLAYFIGNELRDLNVVFSSTVFFSISLLFIAVAFVYPHKKDKPVTFSIRYTYLFRKSCDLAVATCSFCLLCCLANNPPLAVPVNDLYATNNSTVPAITEKPTAQEILSSLQYRDKKSLTRSEKRTLKKEFKHQLKVYAVAKVKGDSKTAGQALLILLAIIGAVGLLYLVAALACSLSCNGSDVAAVFVGVVGTIAVIWLLVYVIKQISHPKKKNNTETQKQE
jgi:hypothetical protein